MSWFLLEMTPFLNFSKEFLLIFRSKVIGSEYLGISIRVQKIPNYSVKCSSMSYTIDKYLTVQVFFLKFKRFMHVFNKNLIFLVQYLLMSFRFPLSSSPWLTIFFFSAEILDICHPFWAFYFVLLFVIFLCQSL